MRTLALGGLLLPVLWIAGCGAEDEGTTNEPDSGDVREDGGSTDVIDDTGTDAGPVADADAGDGRDDAGDATGTDTADDAEAADTTTDTDVPDAEDVSDGGATDATTDAADVGDVGDVGEDADVIGPECGVDLPCVDDNACDGLDACVEGRCVAGEAPADGTACTVEGDEAADGICLDEVCVVSTCGDGFTDLAAGEQCDDSDTDSGDGCSAECRIECSALDAEPCDDGLACTLDTCNAETGLCEYVASDDDEDGADCLVDCDDGDPFNFPRNVEICDGQDNDCDEVPDNGLDFDSWYRDLPDRDGYGDDTDVVLACIQPGEDWSLIGGDCDNVDPFRNPGAAELCNGVDDDCDEEIDEDFTTLGEACDSPVDTDLCLEGVIECMPGGMGVRCTDGPGSTVEVCDGTDNDCDGSTDEGLAASTWYADCDSDGFAASGAAAVASCTTSAPTSAPVCGGVWTALVPSGVETSDFNDANGAVNPDDSPRLSAIHGSLFSACTGCHGVQGGLSLANNAGLRDRLLAASTGLPTMPRVTPGNVDRSYLWHKVSGTQASVGGGGGKMGAFTTTQFTTLRTWIEHGALP